MKYFTVMTIGDGYHAAPEQEMDIDSFYIALGNAFERLIFVANYNEFDTNWFQFALAEDDGYGVAFYTQR